jgi:hypothetical protein
MDREHIVFETLQTAVKYLHNIIKSYGIFKIEGGSKGEITPQGAKNEALQILCAPL